MELTREQAITEHRKMWRWIAEQYENKQNMDYLTPCQLKEKYLELKGYSKFSLICCCFLCEYTKVSEDDEKCDKCPLDWGLSQDCVGTFANKGLYRRILDSCTYDYNRCAELARQIASLPEKYRLL